MNRTSKRIIEYPFQPLRRSSRRCPQPGGPSETIRRFAQVHNTLAGSAILIDPEHSTVIFL
jgi:hypothetical protein